MKKILYLALILALLLSLAGCGSSAPADGPSASDEAPLAGEILSGLDEAAEEERAAEEETEAAAGEESPAEAETAELPELFDPELVFSTTTLDGAAADEKIFAGHSLTMINFFEPWCPPCVAELPELEKLYETYAPEGFQILGVFSTEEGVEAVLADAGVSYPALRYVSAFDSLQTGYVPTTVFVNGEGKIVGDTQIGSNSYEGWEAIVKELLG